MPRQARQHSETGYYHIVIRGVSGQNIFEDDQDYRMFLEILKVLKPVCDFKLHAYCLMGNRFHLLIKIESAVLSQTFKRIGIRYVNWFNNKYGRTGHLFQDRFKSRGIEDDRQLLTVLRYIHQTPVKEKLCEDPSQYRWSSYGDYTASKEGLTDTSEMLTLLAKGKREAVRRFVKLVDEPVEEACLDISRERKRYTDEDVQDMIQTLCKAKDMAEFQELPEEQKIGVVSELRKEGVSIRQAARMTGMSFAVVRRIKGP